MSEIGYLRVLLWDDNQLFRMFFRRWTGSYIMKKKSSGFAGDSTIHGFCPFWCEFLEATLVDPVRYRIWCPLHEPHIVSQWNLPSVLGLWQNEIINVNRLIKICVTFTYVKIELRVTPLDILTIPWNAGLFWFLNQIIPSKRGTETHSSSTWCVSTYGPEMCPCGEKFHHKDMWNG